MGPIVRPMRDILIILGRVVGGYLVMCVPVLAMALVALLAMLSVS